MKTAACKEPIVGKRSLHGRRRWVVASPAKGGSARAASVSVHVGCVRPAPRFPLRAGSTLRRRRADVLADFGFLGFVTLIWEQRRQACDLIFLHQPSTFDAGASTGSVCLATWQKSPRLGGIDQALACRLVRLDCRLPRGMCELRLSVSSSISPHVPITGSGYELARISLRELSA